MRSHKVVFFAVSVFAVKFRCNPENQHFSSPPPPPEDKDSHASVWPLELGVSAPTLWYGPLSWG